MKIMMRLFFKYFCTFLFLATSFNTNLAAYIDLEANIDDFVVETKKIHIPDYPDAFNPSIIRWKGSLLLLFRYRAPVTGSTDPMALVWLDEDFNVTGKPIHLFREFEPGNCPSRGQDARLINYNDDLYIIYNNFVNTSNGSENRRIFISKVLYNELFSTCTDYEVITTYPEEIPTRQEKNWVPFVFMNTLFLAYSINPHQILLPLLHQSGRCIPYMTSQANIQWNWGEIRGGTPALKVDDSYLAFFHSVRTEATVQSNGIAMSHYFMGAYLFNATPPFQVTHISPKPIIGPNFYNGPAYVTWKPLRVVFPGGFVFNDEYIWVCYGRQDHESWVVKLDKQKLLKQLVATGNGNE